MKFIGKAIVACGMFFFYAALRDHNEVSVTGPPSWLASFAIGTVLALIGSGVLAASNKEEFRERDKFARDTIGALQQQTDPRLDRPFALYLRPFLIDGKVATEDYSASVFDFEQYDRLGGLDGLERILADAVSATAPLIGLGRDGEALGGLGVAGTLPDWQSAISKAISKAQMVFFVPAPNPGTFWEFGELASQNVLAKTIFIMPPATGALKYGDKDGYAANWEAARTRAQVELGLALPAYEAAGCMFRFAGDRIARAKLEVQPRRLAANINKLL